MLPKMDAMLAEGAELAASGDLTEAEWREAQSDIGRMKELALRFLAGDLTLATELAALSQRLVALGDKKLAEL